MQRERKGRRRREEEGEGVIFTSIKSNWVVSLDTLPAGHVFEMHRGEGNAFRFVQHFAVESSSCFVHPTTCQLRALLTLPFTTSLFVCLLPSAFLPPHLLSPSLSPFIPELQQSMTPPIVIDDESSGAIRMIGGPKDSPWDQHVVPSSRGYICIYLKE